MRHEIRLATEEDIQFVAQHLRATDATEIWASHRRRPEDLPDACREVECYCGLLDGVPVCLFGCNDCGSFGAPWLLGTDMMALVPVSVLRESRRRVRQWLERYRLLTNYVHAKNRVSMDWLSWIGFRFPDSAIVNGELFWRFEMRCEYV